MAVLDASQWESLVWPRWLPEPARLPLVAQITGAVALTALVVAPWWARIPEAPTVLESVATPHLSPVPLSRPIAPSPAATLLDAGSGVAAASADGRPAHLNLDVRHAFGEVDLAVTVDGKPAFNSQLDGGGKRFKMFGKRAERGFTHTLDLTPGVRVVRVRVRSADANFDQTRVERFELGSASVAALQVTADKTGMSLVAKHPPAPAAGPVRSAPVTPAAVIPAAAPPLSPVAPAASSATAVPLAQPAESKPSPVESALVELVHSLRSMLIAIAGFVASAATGFVVQEFLRRRRTLLFAESPAAPAVPTERRRRRRPGPGPGTVRVTPE